MKATMRRAPLACVTSQTLKLGIPEPHDSVFTHVKLSSKVNYK